MLSIINEMKSILHKLNQVYDQNYLYSSILSVVRGYFFESEDRELWAFFCAIVNKQISVINWLRPMLEGLAIKIMKEKISFKAFLKSSIEERERILSTFEWTKIIREGERKKIGWTHRLIPLNTLNCFFNKLNSFTDEFESLHGYFESAYSKNDEEIKLEKPIRKLSEIMLNYECICYKNLNNADDCGCRGYVFPHHKSPSAFKTINLFIRWMVRPELDLNLWNFISKKDLIYPLDVGIARVINRLGLLPRVKENWITACAITKLFKEYFDKEDPVRFDFPLSRLGILKICKKNLKLSDCSACIFGVNELCPSSIGEDLREEELRTILLRSAKSQYNKLKGDYLESKVSALLIQQGYIQDNDLRYIPIVSQKIKKTLLEQKCVIAAKYSELDIVSRNINNDVIDKYIIVECKFHNRAIGVKEVKCFNLKCDNFKEFIISTNKSVKDKTFEKWFVSVFNFEGKANELAESLNIRTIDSTDLNTILRNNKMRTIPLFI